MTTNIQKAREWAEWAVKRRGVVELHANALAAAEVIQSLPDQWVDAEKLREALDGWGIAGKALRETDLGKQLEALIPAPPLRTLSDMTPEERDTQKWMQAKVFPTASTPGIITGVDEYARSAIILFADGMAKNVPWDHITPLPDLPKLEWPSLSLSGESEAVSVETEDVTEESRTALPHPEDVPAGEPWIVEDDGHEWVGARDDSGTTNYPWALAKIDGTDYALSQDVEVTLVSRLVPEVKP